MGWWIIGVIYIISLIFVIYEYITAPLIKDDEKPSFFNEEDEEENTSNSDDTEVTTE